MNDESRVVCDSEFGIGSHEFISSRTDGDIRQFVHSIRSHMSFLIFLSSWTFSNSFFKKRRFVPTMVISAIAIETASSLLYGVSRFTLHFILKSNLLLFSAIVCFVFGSLLSGMCRSKQIRVLFEI